MELDSRPLALGGAADHIHLLARLNTSVSPATLVGRCKGLSSRIVSQLWPALGFRWAKGYSCFSVSSNRVPMVQRYVLDQHRRHAEHGPWTHTPNTHETSVEDLKCAPR